MFQKLKVSTRSEKLPSKCLIQPTGQACVPRERCPHGFSLLPPQVKVLFAGQDIDKSPYTVNVAKAMGDPSKVHARGPGLDPVGNVANKPTYFDIYTAGQWRKVSGFP